MRDHGQMYCTISSYNIQHMERRSTVTFANNGDSKSEHSRKRERGLRLREKNVDVANPILQPTSKLLAWIG